MINTITSKRNKIELLDDLLDGLVRRHSGDFRYPYNRIDLADIDQMSPQIAEDIVRLHFKRVDIGYASNTNNPEFDEYIEMAFRSIEFIANNFDTDLGAEYLNNAMNILNREERNPFEKGSSFKSYITDDMYIVKIPLEIDEKGNWKNHIFGSIRSAYLSKIIPVFQLGDGIYELYFQGNKIVKFDVIFGCIQAVKEDANFIEYLKTEEVREQEFLASLRKDYPFYDPSDVTFEEFVQECKEKMKPKTSKHSELYPVFQQFYPLYVEEAEEEEEDFEDYNCSNCKDGGCLYCNPQDFL